MCFFLLYWDAERKSAALVDFAFRPDLAAVRFNQMAGDG